jgi:hypothetical protein
MPKVAPANQRQHEKALAHDCQGYILHPTVEPPDDEAAEEHRVTDHLGADASSTSGSNRSSWHVRTVSNAVWRKWAQPA